MAGSSGDGQEKTEQATPHRLEDAAKKGQVPYSTELTNALLFTVFILSLWLLGGGLVAQICRELRRGFTLHDLHMLDRDGATSHLQELFSRTLEILTPIFVVTLIICGLGGLLQVGFRLAGAKIEPKLDKLDPIKGMKKLFSMRSVMMVVFSILKIIVVAVIVFGGIQETLPIAATLGQRSTDAVVSHTPALILRMGMRIGAIILVLGILDLLWQRYQHTKDMMMSKEDVKEDTKRSEGDPKIKARVREIQREIARARMMEDVKTATVVVRNPTHFAVALRYEREKDPAPRVVAKGKDLIALRIISIAEEAKIPVRTDPPLARRIHDLVPIGKVVPEELFRAVAKLIAWVLQERELEEARS